MADSEPRAPNPFGWPLVAAASLVAAVFQPDEEPFNLFQRPAAAAGEQPGEKGDKNEEEQPGKRVESPVIDAHEARLWGDPLRPEGKVQGQPYDRGRDGKIDRLIVVSTRSTVSAEDAEERRRARHALHGAMSVCGFVPRHATQRRWVQIEVPAEKPTLDVCIELFESPRGCTPERPDGGCENPCVCWLPDDVPGKRAGYTNAAIGALRTALGERAPVVLVGPSTTSALLDMRVAGIHVLSPWVTGATDEQVAKFLSGGRPTSYVCDDSVLAGRLVGELALRGIEDRGEVLLVLERDSQYARTWSRHLREAWPGSEDAPGFRTAWFSRGIYADAAADETRKRVELPEGSETLDYLRRLKGSIDAADGVRAVGVFGIDVRDKILIFEALAKVLPDAVLFTSDLEAFYSHPSALPFTRNMIVASTYGLLPPEPSGTPPLAPNIEHVFRALATPFRSSYQTATYLAFCDAVLADLPPTPVAARRPSLLDLAVAIMGFARSYVVAPASETAPRAARPVHAQTLAARGKVFEIGRLGPVECDAHDPARTSGLAWFAAALVGVLVLAALAHFQWLARAGGGRAAGRIEGLGWYVAIGGVVALCAATLICIATSAEPVSWFDGVSIWPTEVVRLLALSLALVFAYHVLRAIRDPLPDLEGAVRVSTPSLLWRVAGALPLRLRRLPRRRFLRSRAFSAAVAAGLFLAIGQVLMVVLGRPIAPARGTCAQVIDVVIILSTVAAMLWLMFLVAEFAGVLTRICKRETDRIGKADVGDGIEAWQQHRRVLHALATAGGNGIYGPFVVIMLLALSRWSGFDDWSWPPALVILVLLCVGVVVAAHVALHRAASRLRGAGLERLSVDRETCRDKARARALASLRADLDKVNEGIFAGPTNHPVLKAAIIPFAGVGGLSLLQFVHGLG